MATVCLFLTGLLILATPGGVNGANRPPVWRNTLQGVLERDGIEEDRQPGSEIGYLQATDPDDDQVTFSTNSAHFGVHETSGLVTLRTALDAEAASQVSVTFTATDSEGNSITTTSNVLVIDVNDNAPVFTNAPYLVTVREDTEVGSVVYNMISVRDRDKALNAIVEFSCSSQASNIEATAACKKFRVTGRRISAGFYVGSIVLKEAIDYETKHNYVLILQAQDQGDPAQMTTVHVVIDVIDIQDTPPIFLNVPMSLFVYENTPAGNVVGKVQARDQDAGDPSPLRLHIKSDPRNFFRLGPTVEVQNRVYSAEIRSSGQIDREILEPGFYQFTVQATELVGPSRVPSTSADRIVVTSVRVTVTDVNDNPPRFNAERYTVNIPEQLGSKAKIPNLDMVVSDSDLGKNAYFELRILDSDKRRMFSLSPTSGTRSAAISLVITDSRFIDYEQPDYRRHIVTILATETQTGTKLYSTATVTINVIDDNDNMPRFEQSGYTASVREDRQPPYHVITVIAHDADSGSFGKISYSLVGTMNEKFSINAVTGRVTLAEQLDFETDSVISLQCRATDGGGQSTSVTLTVTVLDYNDQAPVFQADQHYTFASESSTVLAPNIVVHAEDADTEVPVTYHISSGNTRDNAFRVGRESGVFSLSRNVDYQETPDRRGFFEVFVEASDNGRIPQVATTSVIVTVRDENNHWPQFSISKYYKTVTEISPKGMSVVQVSATDNDAGGNAKISYVLRSGSRDNFAVDFDTGLVLVSDSANLDIERFGSAYRLIIHAIDGGSPDKTGTAEVFITVTDSNNKVPVFTQDVYLITVSDSVPVGTPVKTITANDPDASASLQYSIRRSSISAEDKNGNPLTSIEPFNYKEAFRIWRVNASIETALALSRDAAAEVTFIVETVDVNAEEPPLQTATATVIITIRSDEERGITFPAPWTPDDPTFRITIPEEGPFGAEHVIRQLTASDPQSSDPVRSFSEVPGSDPLNYFSVRHDTGEIYLNRRLDYDTSPPTTQIRFQVVASTAGGPPVRSAIATVIVDIDDINDNSPRFMQHEYQFSVRENERYPTQLGVVVASDRDSGPYGNITYSLEGQGAEFFYIDPLEGEILIAQNATLDREIASEYQLLVKATDNGGDSGESGDTRSTALPLVITVEDVNDNAPRFSEPLYEVSVLETTDSQTSLTRVRATDRDTGSNAVVTYSVSGGDDSGLFYVETTTGVIRTKSSLSGHARQTPYDVTVTASDAGNPPLSSQTTVRVFINSRQTPRGKPRFIFPPEDGYHINIPEEVPVGWNFTRISVTDSDGGDGGQLTYYFLHNGKHVSDQGPFHIDKATGVITTTGRIDRESNEIYQLTIVVRDNGNPPQETIRTIFFDVTDIDDHKPSFDCPELGISRPLVAHVTEEQKPPVLVTRVQGCDDDAPPNNYIYYFIEAGNECESASDDEAPFWINMTSGEIMTRVALDREQCARYTLTIRVQGPAESEEEGRRRRRDTAAVTTAVTPELMQVIIIVDDIDDNGPRFINERVITSVLASSPVGTRLVRVSASDRDDAAFSNNRYSLSGATTFHRRDRKEVVSVDEAFVIDEETGVVTTRLADYLDYLDGVFQMKVTAADQQGYKDDVTLMIYVVRSNQRLRFVFDVSPQKMRSQSIPSIFLRYVTNFLKNGTKLNPDSLHYHVGHDAEIFYEESDLCFHVVESDKVVNPDVALKMLAELEEKYGDLVSFYRQYSMTAIDLCQVKVTTRWWSGYWYLWWMLIAAALFIFLVSVILICCYCCNCCGCCDRPSDIIAAKPVNQYVVLRPPVDPLVVDTSALAVNPEIDFEWQEAEYSMT